MAKTTINGTILKPDDTAEEGYIYFALSTTASLDGVVHSRVPIRVNLDNDGQFTIDLQPTDDAGWSVEGLSYLVEERFSGKAPRRFYMTVPTSGSALDYADLATYANAPSINANQDLAAEWVAWQAAADASYVAEGSAFSDIAKYAGVDPTGVTECAAAINTAITAIAALGRRPYAKGTFKIASTVTIACNADFGDATFSYTGTSGTAVLVGTAASGGYVSAIEVKAPKLTAAAKTATGWGQVSGTIGIDVANLYESRVTVPFVRNFETGLRLYGKGKGCVYNHVEVGHLSNNKINHLLDADSTGWCNENIFTVGRYSHDSAEGTNVADTRMVKTGICTNPVNNNLWIKPCFEGNVAEYHLECAGTGNRFLNGRWEASSPKVWWRNPSSINVIDLGYNSSSIVETFEAGAAGSNTIVGHNRSYHTRSGGTSGILILENISSGSYPADVVMAAGARAAGTSPVTGYEVSRSATQTLMKRAADSYPRLRLDHVNGRVYLGNASADPDAYIGGGPGYVHIIGNILWLTTNTYDLGSSSYRPRDLYLGRDIEIDGALNHDGSTVGFYGTTPAAKPTVAGSRGGNAALASLLTGLAALGLIADSTSA